MAKILYYLTFCFIGIFCAEVISGSAPFAPLFPPFYGLYGLVDVLLLDLLIRRRGSSWLTVYLAGVIVGYLTESFAAKVMWFGWPDSKLNLWGVLPIPEVPFLALFYHPIFSFCVPVYLMRRFLACPLPLPTSRLADRLLCVWPLFTALTLKMDKSIYLLKWAALDLLILAALVWLLSRLKTASDIRLGRKSRVTLAFLLPAIYVFAFFKMPAFGRTVVMLPGTFQICFSAVVLLLLTWMLWRRLPPTSNPESLPLEPAAIHPASVTARLLYVLVVMAACVMVAALTPGAIHFLSPFVFLPGMIIGTVLFLRVCVASLRQQGEHATL